MSVRLKILLGVGATALVLLLALLVFFYYLVTRSFPKTSGSISLPGLSAEVQVYRDHFGVPHIVAQSERDAYIAVGFVHAQDRLWQMELIRRAGAGKLSEVLGAPAVSVDRLFRTLGLRHHAQLLEERLDEQTRAELQAYADGVSTFIATHKGKYPVEFDLLHIEPEPWSVEHSLLVSRLMAWELNTSRWVDLTLSELVEQLGIARASEVFPSWPEGAPLIIPDELRRMRLAHFGRELMEMDRSYRALLGTGAVGGGSNSWVVAGSRSTTGKPLLANDPHLMYSLPARWYELHVSAPGLDVAGATLPGVPFVILGRNRSIAWGITNAMVDGEDFYVEEVNDVARPTKYRLDGGWRPVEERLDTILVKNEPPILLSIYRTHRGPIINRVEPAAMRAERPVSFRWVGFELSNDARTFSQINRAKNWTEFREALRHFATPAQNFVYADVEGNIGYRTGGLIPMRGSKSGILPFPGWTSEYEWRGFVPFAEMPELLNPPEGFIATANNKIVSNAYPHYIAGAWEPHWRITRITELLRSRQTFSIDDFERMQNDVVSPHSREVVPIILDAFEGEEIDDPEVELALTYFRNWNHEMSANDVATTLFQSFFVRMIRNTFEDEMGSGLAALYDTLASMPMTVLTEMMKRGSSTWFDNVRTPELETMDDIIRLSLAEGVRELRSRLGGKLKEWQWQRVHAVEFRHVFGDHPLLGPVFNLGPFPVGGSHSTVSKGDYRLAQPFGNHLGPSTRQIFDLADPNNGRGVTPPGQSGQVFQRHYGDQVRLWLNGSYRRWVMDIPVLTQMSHDLLVLRPDR